MIHMKGKIGLKIDILANFNDGFVCVNNLKKFAKSLNLANSVGLWVFISEWPNIQPHL